MLKCAEEMHRNALYAALQVPEEARFWSEEDLEAFFDSNGSLVALGRKAPALSTKPQIRKSQNSTFQTNFGRSPLGSKSQNFMQITDVQAGLKLVFCIFLLSFAVSIDQYNPIPRSEAADSWMQIQKILCLLILR